MSSEKPMKQTSELLREQTLPEHPSIILPIVVALVAWAVWVFAANALVLWTIEDVAVLLRTLGILGLVTIVLPFSLALCLLYSFTKEIDGQSHGDPWGRGDMTGLLFGTLILPLIGIVFGIVGIIQNAKRKQGTILLALGTMSTLCLLLFAAPALASVIRRILKL